MHEFRGLWGTPRPPPPSKAKVLGKIAFLRKLMPKKLHFCMNALEPPCDFSKDLGFVYESLRI
jgi:hypothetical protein